MGYSQATKTSIFEGSSGLISTMICSVNSVAPVFAPQSTFQLESAIDAYLAQDDGSDSPHGPIGEWDVSLVTDMNGIFFRPSAFDGDISNWDVSRVTDMIGIFFRATRFNSDISKWDVSSVTDMSNMFSSAESFDGDLSNWDVSRVSTMVGMFRDATSFNGDISKWDVSNVANMDGMLYDASAFKRIICTAAWAHSTASKTAMFQGSSGSTWSLVCTSSHVSVSMLAADQYTTHQAITERELVFSP